MVNLGLNWSSLLGIILAVSGAGLYFLRSWRPKLARDHDIFFAAIGLLCGGILLFQGWRLDPILAFGQFLLTGSAIFFAVESIRLRGLATAQAKGRSSSPIVDEDRYVSDVYRVDDDQYDELEPREEDPQMRRLRGTQDSRSSRYEDDRYRPAKGRRSSMDRPSSSERPTRRPRPRPDSRSRSYSDEWEATIDPVDSTPERSSRSSSRRPTSRVESPLDTSENRWDQSRLISILAGDAEEPNAINLVRVGDPNQAINSTFTPADPIYFNWFCETCQKQNSLTTMNQAGRSSQIIIDSANFVVHWVNQQWLTTQNKSDESIALPFRPQNIVTVEPDDPQPDANPQPEGSGIVITNPDDVYQTVELIGKQAIALFKAHPERNAAILVRENRQARFLASELAYLQREHEIKIYDVGERERYSQIPAEILQLLQFIARPHSPDNLKAALEVLQQRSLIPAQDLNALATSPEQFLYPTPLQPPAKPQVAQARRYCVSLLNARLELPHYQLIPFLGMTLGYTGSELATVNKLADKINLQIKTQSSLNTAIETLTEIVNAENFEGVEADNGDRYTRANQITIITMHKAKGLDWDYVFIPFLHQDLIPGQPWIPNAGKFLGSYTLSEVARAQIRAIVHHQYLSLNEPQTIPLPMTAWQEAVKLKQAEEYRLLYVAMTRAKRLLWMSAAELGPFRWSVFRSDRANSLQQKKPCPVIPALVRYLTAVRDQRA